ncbi:MAG TPA: XrtA system polysaccharide chain length determinant [Steroidobacteraceae bacterium]|nr:XrtA system polysaccharide chain length determinant [Steroidobacteraceae bacterium]
MQELIDQLVLEFWAAWRFRWLALTVAWGVALVGWGVVLVMPNSYEANATVYVDTETVLKPLLTGLAVNTDLTNRVQMISAVLMSRPNLEKVARDTDLYLRARTPEDLEQLLGSLPNQVKLGAGGNSTYTIGYRDADPLMAHRVVRRFLDTFVEGTIGVKREDSEGAQRFLREQIHEYEQKLRQAEDSLADFKKRNVGVMPGERGDYYTRLQSSVAKVEQLRARVRVAQDKRTELLRELEGEEPTFGLVPSTGGGGPSGPNDLLIAQHRAQLESLLVHYTEKHPQVVGLRDTIERLQEENRKAIAAGDKSRPIIDPAAAAQHKLEINPVYQSMKIALSQTELELIELRNQLGNEEATVADLRSKVNTIPEIEAQLVRLNRDYEVNRAQYTALVQRLESARLSEQAEQSSEHVKFRVIEPPIVPLTPVAPNRLLLMTAALLAALGAGIGAALVLHRLQPVFMSRKSLVEATGLPVLGTISRVLDGGQQRALQLQPVYYSAALGMLLVAFAASVVLSDSASAWARAAFG